MLGQQERIGLGTSGTHVDVCFGIILSWKFHVLPSAVESVKTKRKRNESANALRPRLAKARACTATVLEVCPGSRLQAGRT